jgi:hypothetical protein
MEKVNQPIIIYYSLLVQKMIFCKYCENVSFRDERVGEKKKNQLKYEFFIQMIFSVISRRFWMMIVAL